MGFSLTIPVVGQPHSTEDVKVGNDFTTLQTWGNGNIADADLAAPSSAVRKLLFQACSTLNSVNHSASGGYLLGQTGATAVSGASTSSSGFFPLWSADSGLSSQPTDFQLSGRSPFARVRAVVATNGTAPAITITVGLYLITGTSTGAGSIGLTAGSALAGSTVAVATPSSSTITPVESAQFAMPVTVGHYALGVNLSGSMTANAAIGVSAELFGYNA